MGSRILFALALLLAAPVAASAQSGCSYIYYGAVLTPQQWQNCFQQKQDNLGYSPVNKAGDTMSGPLVAWPSSSTKAGFILTPGTAPSSPADGSIWVTSSGVYVQVNGSTVGPLTGGTASDILDSIGSTQGDVLYRGSSGWAVLPPGTSGYVLTTGGTGADPSWTAAGSGTVTSVGVTAGTGITQSGSPITSSGNITVNVDKATAGNFQAGTSDKVLTADTVFTSETTTAYGTTTTFDFSTFINTAVTLTGNITTMTCSNIKAGQAGMITLIEDGSGGHTTVWCSQFKFANGTAPSLNTSANAVNVLPYSCRSATFCVANLLQDVK